MLPLVMADPPKFTGLLWLGSEHCFVLWVSTVSTVSTVSRDSMIQQNFKRFQEIARISSVSSACFKSEFQKHLKLIGRPGLQHAPILKIEFQGFQEFQEVQEVATHFKSISRGFNR